MAADPDKWAGQGASGVTPDGLLAHFSAAGVLTWGDVHVATALARLGEEPDELVALAAALAVRAPRVGHVLAELSTVRETATADREDEQDLSRLPWPELVLWTQRLSRSPLVADELGPPDRPLRLVGTALYLDRYWRDEVQVASDLLGRATAGLVEVDDDAVEAGLARLFADDRAGLQALAAARAARRYFSVIAGGPGTGKTTTVARLLALVDEQAFAAGHPPPLVALAAPTGKAAARMAEAVRAEARKLDVDETVRNRLLSLDASTVHRLLGRHPASANRFRHHRDHRLPHDVVVVDETSMLSLSLMARLVEAVRPDARLVLLGDQQQLASVEAGAVLGDIVGPAATAVPPRPGRLTDCITVLRANHRFHGPLSDLASAVRAGDEDAVMTAISPCSGISPHSGMPPSSGVTDDDDDTDGSVTWLPVDAATAAEALLAPVRSAVLAAGRPMIEAARLGDGPGALDALERLRLLCAHREGPSGVGSWNARAEQWLADEAGTALGDGAWYVGRPVIVTENDYGLGLFNGDVGVVVARTGGGLTVAFRRWTGVVTVSPARVPRVETAFAMTAHRAQGSEFEAVVVVMPAPSSRVLTRELLYTAVTRARRRVVLVGTEAAVRAAVGRAVARASGLTARLWG